MERIETQHPSGKKGVNIELKKYEFIKAFILDLLAHQSPITFKEMSEIGVKTLSDEFDGKVLWYLVTVKLDLEARGLIRRVPKSSPHQLTSAKT